MDIERLLETLYRVYRDDLEIEDNPPVNPEAEYGEGDIVELQGNIYVYLWKREGDRWEGLLATPYTLLAHPIHPRVKTDSPLYEVMAITDLRIPLTDETIRRYITDRVEVLEDKNLLEEKIEQSLERKKVYHPIREKFLRDEARRTAFLIEEFLKEEFETPETRKGIVIRVPKKVWEKVQIPRRLAASGEQQIAENDHFLVIKQSEKDYALLVKDENLLGREIKLFIGGEPIFKGILDSDTIIVEIDRDIPPTALADLIKVEV